MSVSLSNGHAAVEDVDSKVEDDETLLNDILQESGCWSVLNVWVFFATASVVIQQAGQFIWPVFAVAHIPHQCNLPGSDSNPNHFENVSSQYINSILFDPNDSGCRLTPNDRGCAALNVNLNSLVEESVYENVTIEELLMNKNQSEVLSNALYMSCERIGHGYAFQPDGVVQTSVVSEFDLVCDRQKWVQYEKTVFILAQLVSSIFLAPLVDIFGRRKVLLWLLAAEFVVLLFLTFSVNALMVVVMRFLMSLFNTPKFSIVIAYGCEVVPLQYRTLYGMLPSCFFGVGVSVFAIVSYFATTWRFYTATAMLLTFPNLIMWFLLPESPRWLIQQKLNEQFIVTMRFMEKVNRTKFSDEIWKRIDKMPLHQTKKEGIFKEKLTTLFEYYQTIIGVGPPGSVSFIDLFKNHLLRKWIFYFSVNWIAIMLLYYSLTFGSELFNLDSHTFTIINGAIEGPSAICACLGMMYIGRRTSQSLFLIICAFTVAGTIFLQDFSQIMLICACLSRFCASAAFGIVFMYTGETMPTLLRHTGICFCSAVCRFFGMLYPYIGMLNVFWMGTSATILSVLSLISAILCFMLPETKNQQLPETVNDCYLLSQGKLKKRSLYTAGELTSASHETGDHKIPLEMKPGEYSV